MRVSFKVLLFLAVIFFGAARTASAHLVGGSGLASGLAHPWLGLDHFLAAVAVGIISGQFRGRKRWKIPAAFIFFMGIGGLVAIAGFKMPIAETGVALSLLIFGIFIALLKKISVSWATAAVILFAIFHGHVHGEELPLLFNPAFYAIGLVAGTALLHAAGIFIGHYARQARQTSALLRYAGAGLSLMGLIILSR